MLWLQVLQWQLTCINSSRDKAAVDKTRLGGKNVPNKNMSTKISS